MDLKSFFKKPEVEKGGFLTFSNLRDFSILVFFAACAYRLAVSEVSIDLSGFGFTDLLSLILAISAIVLSAAFYFKADESSKSFYNNSYEFTKNISELLGRIEERFGAQLININKGYDDLNNKFVNIPMNVKEVQEEQQKEREIIKRTEEDYQKIINDLMVKARLDDVEMARIRDSMTELARDADNAKLELARHTAALDDESVNPLSMSDRLFSFLSAVAELHFDDSYKNASATKIANRFNMLITNGVIPPTFIVELSVMGLCTDGALNARGALMFRRFIK